MNKKIFLFIICFIGLINNVQAESLCSYEEQRKLEEESANIKIVYEPIEEEIGDDIDGVEINRRIKVTIYNIGENVYLILKDDSVDENNCFNCGKTINYEDTENGVYTFDWKEFSEVANFTINVYSSINTNCPDEMYKTLYLSLPRFNNYSQYGICDELKEFYLCQEYVLFDNIAKDEFLTQVYKYKNKTISEEGEEIKESTLDKIFIFINDYKLIIIGGFVVVGGISFVIYIITTKKQRELGL